MVPSPDRPFSLDPIPFVRGLGQLITEARLAAIVLQTSRASERHRRLPAESVIWLVIAMALFAADSIPKLWRRLHPGRDEPEPDDSAFTQARKRLCGAPLRRLCFQVARPTATHQAKGASYGGWRLMGIDGTTFDLPDTPAIARTFGRPKGPHADAAFPQVSSWPYVNWAPTPSAAWPSSRSATARHRCSANCSATSARACCWSGAAGSSASN